MESTAEERTRRIVAWKQAAPPWTGNFDYFHSKGLYEGTLTVSMRFSPLGLPPVLTAEEIVEHIFRSPLLLERVCAAGWLSPIPDVEEPLFSKDAAYIALDRLLKGEKPDRLKSEPPHKAGSPEIGKAGFHGLVKASKAAEALGISVRSLSEYATKGLIKPIELGKHRLYNVPDIIAKLEKERDRKAATHLTEGAINDILR